MKKTLLLALSLAVAGCTTTGGLNIPDSRLECAEEPGRPAGSGPAYTDAAGVERHEITDEDNGTYLRALRAAGQSCRDAVAWIKDYVTGRK